MKKFLNFCKDMQKNLKFQIEVTNLLLDKKKNQKELILINNIYQYIKKRYILRIYPERECKKWNATHIFECVASIYPFKIWNCQKKNISLH